MFQFDSVGEFIAMGGHGAFVWSAYGITLAVMLWLVARPVGRRQRLLKAIGRQHLRGAGER